MLLYYEAGKVFKSSSALYVQGQKGLELKQPSQPSNILLPNRQP